MSRKPTSAEKTEALLLARQLIRQRHTRFICVALDDVIWSSKRLEPAAKALKRYITHALGGEITLDGWVSKNRDGLRRERNSMREYRLQWIDWMISQLGKP
jgi:hypothetical protein